MELPASLKLERHVAIVTGGDSGIGQAIALLFANHGADILVTYNSDQEGAQETVAVAKKWARKALALKVDVSKEAAVERMFDRCLKTLGAPSILVNNAGINGAGIPVAEMELSRWNEVLAVNLTGPFLCSRRFIRELGKSKLKGKIINITSVHEEIPTVGSADYCAAKAGLRNLTRVLALELSDQNVTVNNIAPGMILTPMNQKAVDDPKARERAEKNIPMRRAGEPEEIARMALFLASDGSYCTGQTYFVDGGLMLQQGQGA